MTGRTRFRLVISLTLVLASQPGCRDPSGVEFVKRVEIERESFRLTLGQQVNVQATALDVNGAFVTGVPISFHSTDTTVFHATSGGRLTGKTFGTARLVATVGQYADTATVTVSLAVGDFSWSPNTEVYLHLDSVLTLSVVVVDTSGVAADVSGIVRFAVDDTTVATVDASGVVRGRAPGEFRPVITLVFPDSESVYGPLQPIRVVPFLLAVEYTEVGEPTHVAVRSDGMAVVSHHGANSLTRVLLSSDGVQGNSISTGDGPWDIVLSPAGDLAYVTQTRDSSVGVFDLAAGSLVRTIPVPGRPRGIALNTSGTIAMVATEHGRVYRVSVVDGTVTDSAGPGGLSQNAGPVAFDSVSHRFYAGIGSNVIELDTLGVPTRREFISSTNLSLPVRGVWVTPDGTELWFTAWASFNVGSLRVASLASGVVETVEQISRDGPNPPAYYPSGLTGYGDDTLVLVAERQARGIRVYDRAAREFRVAYYLSGLPVDIGVHAPSRSVIVPNPSGWVDILR